VRFVGADNHRPISRLPGIPATASAERAARAFLGRYGRYFGLRDQARELALEATVRGPRGRAAVRLQQIHAGVPVLGGELVVNVDRDRNVLSVAGELSPEPSIGVEPTIGAGSARAAAIAAVAKAQGVPQVRLHAGAPELWIHDSRLLGGGGLGIPRLTWRSEVSAANPPIRELVLVDAELGSVTLHFDQIADAKDRRVCDAANTDSAYPCGPAAPDRSEGDGPTGVTDVDDAYEFAGDTYDFFANRFGRDSLDDAGMSLASTVRYCPSGEPCPYDNAYWDGEQMVYGEGFAAADDVVGHELTHGVTEFSSGLFYYYQSGAINESLSDVFGELVDLTNGVGSDAPGDRWLLGEDLPGSGAIRDMAAPTSFGDPDRMTSPNYTADSSELDSGGVHTNSGVNNKAAYLMTDGDTFNGQTVSGLGIDKVAAIYYDVDTAMLTSASDYADLASGLRQSCSNLVGTIGITAPDCDEVDGAVLATEMDEDPAAAPAPEAPTCTSGTPADLFADDLENPASGNWTLSADVGTNEWYYPQGTNPYGFDPTYATSGSTNFWGFDRDAIGDFSIEMASDVTVPAGSVFMRFEHAYGFEDSDSPTRNWDGGVVEYSTDGGASWADAGSLIIDNGYSGTIYGGGAADNPLKGRDGFVAESNGYISSRLDLSSLAGEQVRFRFRIGTDSSVEDYGWFVDDVRVYECENVDTDPPQTTIDSGPTGLTNDASPSFSFSSDEGGSSFQCRLDSGEWGACSSPRSYTGLPDGPHSFEVRATDAALNTDPTPALAEFTIDTDPPSVSIDSGPSGPTNQASPEFTFSVEAGAGAECSIDTGSPDYGPCSGASSHSPEAPLADGPYTFRLRATDPATNQSTETRGFSVDTVAPETEIDSGPTGLTDDASPSFSFSSDEPGSSFQCRLDSGAWGACSSPRSYTGLPEGPHSFEVRATDAALNTDPTPALAEFTIDTEPPAAADTTLDGLVHARSRQGQRRRRIAVRVKIKPLEDLTAEVTGRIEVRKRSYPLAKKRRQLTADEKKRIGLKPRKRKHAKRIVKALRKGKKARARLRVRLTDSAGNELAEGLRVRLKRRARRGAGQR
jgi:bacillolysin